MATQNDTTLPSSEVIRDARGLLGEAHALLCFATSEAETEPGSNTAEGRVILLRDIAHRVASADSELARVAGPEVAA